MILKLSPKQTEKNIQELEKAYIESLLMICIAIVWYLSPASNAQEIASKLGHSCIDLVKSAAVACTGEEVQVKKYRIVEFIA